jgi:hypothetical protein
MRDALDSLLKEALKHQLNKKKGVGVKIRLQKIEETVHSAYSNPKNWLFCRVLEIHHIASDGSLTTLGTFREYVYKDSSARKLCRDETLEPQTYECVRGDYWLHLELSPEPTPMTPEEKEQIRQYIARTKNIPLEPLLKEISSDNLLRELDGYPTL